MRLSIGLFGDEQVAGQLLRYADRANDASQWFRMLHRWMEREIEDQFVSEGAHWGSAWPALSPGYAAAKVAAGYGDKPILQREGSLFRSLTQPAGAPDAIREVRPGSMVFGSSVTSEDGYAYGVAHQLGEGVPRRPMLNIGDKPIVKRKLRRSLGLFLATGELRDPGALFGGRGGGGG